MKLLLIFSIAFGIASTSCGPNDGGSIRSQRSPIDTANQKPKREDLFSTLHAQILLNAIGLSASTLDAVLGSTKENNKCITRTADAFKTHISYSNCKGKINNVKYVIEGTLTIDKKPSNGSTYSSHIDNMEVLVGKGKSIASQTFISMDTNIEKGVDDNYSFSSTSTITYKAENDSEVKEWFVKSVEGHFNNTSRDTRFSGLKITDATYSDRKNNSSLELSPKSTIIFSDSCNRPKGDFSIRIRSDSTDVKSNSVSVNTKSNRGKMKWNSCRAQADMLNIFSQFALSNEQFANAIFE